MPFVAFETTLEDSDGIWAESVLCRSPFSLISFLNHSQSKVDFWLQPHLLLFCKCLLEEHHRNILFYESNRIDLFLLQVSLLAFNDRIEMPR